MTDLEFCQGYFLGGAVAVSVLIVGGVINPGYTIFVALYLGFLVLITVGGELL